MVSRYTVVPLRAGPRITAASSLLLALAAVTPADAESLKSTMSSMAATTKAVQAALSSNDLAKAEQLLKAYAGEAQSASALFPGSSQKVQDFRARFTKLSATAAGAGGSPAGLKTAFGSIVSQCRSCHSVYK
jgi:cytochrome c556